MCFDLLSRGMEVLGLCFSFDPLLLYPGQRGLSSKEVLVCVCVGNGVPDSGSERLVHRLLKGDSGIGNCLII